MPQDQVIVSARIHPAIGVARVGNAQDGHFFGPELSSPPRVAPGEHRDRATGALLRQAARFRLYGFNQAGEVVRELVQDEHTRIAWRVQLANLKASWYQFQVALDIPEAATAPPSLQRNQAFAQRAALAITAPPQAVAGANAPPAVCEGRFDGQPVYLGEIATDGAGRLVVLGGRGRTGSLAGMPITTFANNDGWHDDVADGPVTATLLVDGRAVPVDPAWVVVAPPNYAPDLQGVRTMYDLLRDVFIDAGDLPAVPAQVSFSNDVLPIFERLAGLQWVNAGYASAFGHGGTLDLLSPQVVAKLSDDSAANKAFRYEIFNSFRDFDKDSWSPAGWPWLYGDAMELPFAHTPRQNAMLARHQLLCLARWAEGSFVRDDPAGRPKYASIEDVPITQQPGMLDRAALDFCLADAFHPGCEMTWPMRHRTLYMGAFRIRHRRDDEPVPPLGDTLTPADALAPDGPLYGQQAGWITRWMAVPWHTDTASCRSQATYDATYNPFVPTFWPARVPNQVLTEDDYAAAVGASGTQADRVARFRRREDWITETLGDGGYLQEIVAMIDRYGDMGLVTARQGVHGDPDIAGVVYVSDRGSAPAPAPAPGLTAQAAAAHAPARHAIEFTERRGNFPLGPR